MYLCLINPYFSI